MNQALVSILIPTYNRKTLIADTIDSALGQTYRNIEVIVVDNCSTDGTADVVRMYANRDDRVRFYQNENNIGPVNNWKRCLKQATGEYIKILWSDDMMERTFIEKAVHIMENDKSLAFVYSRVCFFRDRTTRGKISYNLGDTGKYRKELFYQMLFDNRNTVPVSPGCALFRRVDVHIKRELPNKIGLSCNKNGAGIDCLIFLMSTRFRSHFYYIDETLNFFRVHKNSISCSNSLEKEYTLGKLYFARRDSVARKYIDRIYEQILMEQAQMNIPRGYFLIRHYLEDGDVLLCICIYIKALLKSVRNKICNG